MWLGRNGKIVCSGSPKETPPAMRFAVVPDILRPLFGGLERENAPQTRPPLRRAPYSVRATRKVRMGGLGDYAIAHQGCDKWVHANITFRIDVSMPESSVLC